MANYPMLSSDGHLYVPDQRNARMSVVHPEHGFVTSHPLRLYMFGYVWDGLMRADDHIVVPSIVLETRRDVLRIYAAQGFRRFHLLTGYLGEMIADFVSREQWPEPTH
jgi:hypothetical protein